MFFNRSKRDKNEAERSKDKGEASEPFRFSEDPLTNSVIGFFFISGIILAGYSLNHSQGKVSGGFPVLVGSSLLIEQRTEEGEVRSIDPSYAKSLFDIRYKIELKDCLDENDHFFTETYPFKSLGLGLTGCRPILSSLVFLGEELIKNGQPIELKKDLEVPLSLERLDTSGSVMLKSFFSEEGLRRGDQIIFLIKIDSLGEKK